MPKTKILVVEDERIVAVALQEVLKYMGYAVTGIAASAEKAIQEAAEARPDLVLMDIRLRGNLDGLRAAKEIRAQFGIPVVYVTAYADKGMLERAQATEPYGYVLKPFKQADLRAVIEEALRKRQMERDLEDRAAACDDTTDTG
jgi:CheY-like chemotaxis protein